MANNVCVAQTFERRGTCVPFTTGDSLRHTRARLYQHGNDRILEAVIPSFGGGRRGELMVVPWKDLPDFVQMSDRDRELHDGIPGIVGKNGIDPLQVRELLHKVNAAYSDDPEERARAREQAQQDSEDKEVVRMSCIAQLMKECGIERGDPVMAGANTKTLVDLMTAEESKTHFDLEMLIDRVFLFASQRSGVSIDNVREWLEPLVGLITPFGTVKGTQADRTNGHLFLEHVNLMEYRKSVAAYMAQKPEEYGAAADVLLEVVDQTIRYVDERIVTLDSLLGSFANVFSQQDTNVSYLIKLRRDVAFALDGWNDLIEYWTEADALDCKKPDCVENRDRAVAYVMNFLPIIPHRELHPEDGFDSQASIERARVKIVAAMHSWSTEALDTELARRVEQGQKKNADEEAGRLIS